MGIFPFLSEKWKKEISNLPHQIKIKSHQHLYYHEGKKKQYNYIYGNNEKSMNHSQRSKESILTRKGTNRNVNF